MRKKNKFLIKNPQSQFPKNFNYYKNLTKDPNFKTMILF